MASKITVATRSPSQTPYQLDPEQTLKASQALLEHIRKETVRLQSSSTKKDLLATEKSDSEEDDLTGDEVPVWLNLTTKQHMVDRARLAPSKIPVPHSLNASENGTICIITADPQRAVKNVVADPTFPAALSTRITRIIGVTKLKDRYKSFEQRRALLAEHDLFLADDRIAARLPSLLGKIFYKGTSKRPIPINVAAIQRIDGKRVKAKAEGKTSKDQGSGPVASPTVVAKEIEKAIGSVAVNLRPGTSLAIRVGLANFTPQQLLANVEVVVSSLISKHVVKGWRNIKSIHIKSPTSMAVPIWLADELWADADDVKDNADVVATEAKAENLKRKRNPTTVKGPQAGSRKKAKTEESKVGRQAEEKLQEASRKEKLAAQKKQAFKAISAVA